MAVHKDGRLVPFQAVDVLNPGGGGRIESVTGNVVRVGPSWRAPIWRALLTLVAAVDARSAKRRAKQPA